MRAYVDFQFYSDFNNGYHLAQLPLKNYHRKTLIHKWSVGREIVHTKDFTIVN